MIEVRGFTPELSMEGEAFRLKKIFKIFKILKILKNLMILTLSVGVIHVICVN